LTLMPGSAVPDVDIVNIDKLVHFFIFGLQMVLTCYALSKHHVLTGRPTKPLFWAFVLSIIFGCMIELIQPYVPGRSFSIVDMIANAIGVVLGYVLFRYLVRKIPVLK
jgi:VanZ family protein